MAENAGRIEYEFAAETDGVLRAGTAVDKATDKMVQDFNKVDKSVKNFNTQTTKTAQGVKRAFGSNLGQAGIQVQQFVGQLQGGQSAMVALAQQSADLGIVLGAPLVGVVVSLAAVLAGTLAPAIFSSTGAIEKMEKAVENTKAVLTIGAYGVANYTDELRNLSTISQELVKIKLNTALAEQQKVIQNVGEAAKQAYKDAIPLFNWSFDNSATSTLFGNLVSDKDLERLGSADPLITKARTGIEKLVNAMRTIEKGNTTRGVEQLTNSIDFLSASAVQNTKAGSELVSQMTKIVEQYKLGKLTIEQLKEAVNDSGDAFKGNAEALQDYLSAIHISNEELKGNAREAERLRLEKAGLEEQEIKTALAAWEYNRVLIENKKATEQAVKDDRKRAESLKEINDQLDAYFEKESQQSTDKDLRQTARLTTQVQSIGLTPEAEIQARYEKELELLRQAEEQKIEIEGTYAQRRMQLESERVAAMQALHAKNNEFLQNAFGNLDTQIAGTFAQVVVGANDGEDAMRSLAGTMLNQVVGAAVQYGIELIKNKMLGKALATSEQANILATTSTGIASQQAATASTVAAAGTTAVAAAPAAALTSTFSFGAAAVIGGAALLGTLAIAKMMGGRQYGGPVSNGMYRVNETGAPEVYSYGGKDYLMNTKNANITPLDKMGGGQQGGDKIDISFNMNDLSDDAIQRAIVRGGDTIVSIVRAYKNNKGEEF